MNGTISTSRDGRRAHLKVAGGILSLFPTADTLLHVVLSGPRAGKPASAWVTIRDFGLLMMATRVAGPMLTEPITDALTDGTLQTEFGGQGYSIVSQNGTLAMTNATRYENKDVIIYVRGPKGGVRRQLRVSQELLKDLLVEAGLAMPKEREG